MRRTNWASSFAAAIALLAGPGLHADEGGALRTWSNSKGTSLEARMFGVVGKKVRLKLEDGSFATVPIASLSEADQQFVRSEGWPIPRKWGNWPDNLQVTLAEIRIDDRGESDGWHIYHSEHFEIAAQENLSDPVVKHVARALEGVHRLLKKSPWGVLATPTNGRFRTELYSSRASYIKAGGPSNSAGVYKTQERIFMVPFESIGLRRTNTGWKSNDQFSMKTMVHELTHMLMADVIGVLPPWLVEGTADYMELIPMRTSTFRPGSLPKELLKHHEFMNTRVVGGAAAPLGPVFRLTLRDWQSGRMPGAGNRSSSASTTSFYHAGLLLTYYFIHLDGRGDAARLQRFFAAAHHNERKLKNYRAELIAYRDEWNTFKERPDVKEVSPGRFKFPDDLKPPDPPSHPFGDANDEPQRFQEYELLLDGRSESALIAEAAEALSKLGLKVRP